MRTILVVDDDPDIRAALCELIALLYGAEVEARRLRVSAAATGEEAVALALGGEPPAVIVMDVNLPGIDGVEAFSRIAAACGGVPIPTVFLTGYAGSGPLLARIGEALGRGALAVLAKPVGAAALAEHIEAALAAATDRTR